MLTKLFWASDVCLQACDYIGNVGDLLSAFFFPVETGNVLSLCFLDEVYKGCIVITCWHDAGNTHIDRLGKTCTICFL